MTTLAEVEIIVTTLPDIYKDAAELIRKNELAKHCMFISKRTGRGRNTLGPADNIDDYRVCTYAALEYAANKYGYYMDTEDFKPLIDALGFNDQIIHHNRDIYSMYICQWNNHINNATEQVADKLDEISERLNLVNFSDNVMC